MLIGVGLRTKPIGGSGGPGRTNTQNNKLLIDVIQF